MKSISNKKSFLAERKEAVIKKYENNWRAEPLSDIKSEMEIRCTESKVSYRTEDKSLCETISNIHNKIVHKEKKEFYKQMSADKLIQQRGFFCSPDDYGMTVDTEECKLVTQVLNKHNPS